MKKVIKKIAYIVYLDENEDPKELSNIRANVVMNKAVKYFTIKEIIRTEKIKDLI